MIKKEILVVFVFFFNSFVFSNEQNYEKQYKNFLVKDSIYIDSNSKQITAIVTDILKNIDSREIEKQKSIIKKYYYFPSVKPEKLKAELDVNGNILRMWKYKILRFKLLSKGSYKIKFYKIPSGANVISEMALIKLKAEKNKDKSKNIVFMKIQGKWRILNL